MGELLMRAQSCSTSLPVIADSQVNKALLNGQEVLKGDVEEPEGAREKVADIEPDPEFLQTKLWFSNN